MNEILKNVTIFDGEKEYVEKDILNNPKLFKFFNTYYILHFPKSLANNVIDENGTFYITTNSNFETAFIELKNVSEQTSELFRQRYT